MDNTRLQYCSRTRSSVSVRRWATWIRYANLPSSLYIRQTDRQGLWRRRKWHRLDSDYGPTQTQPKFHTCDVIDDILSNMRRTTRKSYNDLSQIRKRADLLFPTCDAADGRRSWIGAIPRGSTVLVTEGHISLTAVFAFEIGFPSATCIADGQRHRREDMGTASTGGRALGYLRDDTTVSYIWMYLVSGHKN